MSVVVLCLFQVSAQARCELCRSALENSPDGPAVANSFNHGIIFLLGVPYVIFGAFGAVVYRAHRKKKAAAQRADNPYLPRD